jgi:peptidoglycan/xylan/chitin deacetylase (PgdA/CDA1 family)
MTATVLAPSRGSAPGWPLVLYFHHVNARVDHYTALSPDDFRRGLDLVLSTVGPAVDPAAVRPGFQPPAEPGVLITFDDGYRDNLEQAAPLLAEFGVRVLLFCVTGELDRATAGRPPDPPPRQDFLTWPEAAEFAELGHVLSAHTHSHPKLPGLSEQDATGEVTRSLDRIERTTGSACQTFAYPYGEIPEADCVPPDVLAFGTVKSTPQPWQHAPHRIRRTYLPSGEPELWPELVNGWRRQWFGYP